MEWREEGEQEEKERGKGKQRLLPEYTSKLCLDVDVEWALMVSEGKRLHEKREREKKLKPPLESRQRLQRMHKHWDPLPEKRNDEEGG